MNRPFHYSFKVRNLDETRRFYATVIGCKEGRSSATWIDFDFFGNQISAHLADRFEVLDYCGQVDGIKVPIPHFGAILTQQEFDALKERLENAAASFIVPPYLRYPGQTGQQFTLFVFDPSGNPMEFKSFVQDQEIFAA